MKKLIFFSSINQGIPLLRSSQQFHEGTKYQCHTFFSNNWLLPAINLIPATNTRSILFLLNCMDNTPTCITLPKKGLACEWALTWKMQTDWEKKDEQCGYNWERGDPLDKAWRMPFHPLVIIINLSALCH